eukprot:gene7758-32636_t
MPSIQLPGTGYAKLVMHACKHPTAAVNGILIGRLEGKTVEVTEVVPLFHTPLNLLPMLEAALLQLDEHFGPSGLKIVGYYQANENAEDTRMDTVAKVISEKIRKQFPESFALVVDNAALADMGTKVAVKAFFPDGKADNEFKFAGASSGGGDAEGAGAHQSPVVLTPSAPHVLKAVADLVAAQTYREVVDFDAHLDDVQLDYLNTALNDKITTAIRKAGGVA